ncbi:MAG: M24 family metallopeptidase [Planctomycetes bacterium]|nr:M24 family metallopeptidase [Planctomycetota bacterium]
MTQFDLQAVQEALVHFDLDGWLLCDFRGSNSLARRVLNLEGTQIASRRWFYFVPAAGTPRKLVHRIEPAVLDDLPGDKFVYLRWQELETGVAKLVAGTEKIAIEYSPRNRNPYVARVDAGTVELVRAAGVEIVSSGNLIQQFEATWDEAQWQMHQQAAQGTHTAFDRAWRFIAERIRREGTVTETQVRDTILDHFRENGLTTSHPPIVAVGPNSGNPHYETGTGEQTTISEGDLVLIDLWAKLDRPRAVYSDLTRVGFVGTEVPARYDEVFRIVAAARDAAIRCVRDAFAANRPLSGWEVDQAARDVIEQAGYGDRFVHRTGHSIGQETHGNGANMDNLETREERLILPRTCFSIEPGIYLPEFGVRSEVNVFVDKTGRIHVTGGEIQQQVLAVLARY